MRSVPKILVAAAAVLFAFAAISSAQGVKRLVIVKIDGLPMHYVERFVRQTDPETGKPMLPWFDEIFYKKGTTVPYFYTRGMSLSGPSWGQMDSGQRMQLKGNVEYDRYTGRPYDYLNFVPYYVGYGLRKKADMPAVEVMDQLKIPIFADAFNYERRYTSQQLYQRGNNWEVLASGFINLYPGSPADMIDEWTLGLDFRKMTINQAERDILGKLVKRPEIDYFDYYDVAFDHASHHNNDTPSRLAPLKDIDRLLGRIWNAIQSSSRAAETALVLASDHGTNSMEKVYSQGYNLVKLLGSSAGGGHHVVTKRRLMLDYSLKGIYPLVPLIKTTSKDSFYLRGQTNEYPTALLDFDGNERSSLHLRNSDLNMLHILLQQVRSGTLAKAQRAAVSKAILGLIDRHRDSWTKTVRELDEELDALKRSIDEEKAVIAADPKKFTPDDIALGKDKEVRRRAALNQLSIDNESDGRKYSATVKRLLSLNRETLDARKFEITDLIAPGAMGDPNTLHQLQNYVIGLSSDGIVVGADNEVDLERSFARIDYFDLLLKQRVRNNVQSSVGNRPIDFVAVRVPLGSISDSLPAEDRPNEDPVWLYGGKNNQGLILARQAPAGERSYRYLPVADLRQDAAGKTSFRRLPWGTGFPLKYLEDEKFAIPASERAAWLDQWHSDTEWLEASHLTIYSNAIIGLNEQVDRHPVFDADERDLTADEKLIRRFRQRQRDLTEPDLLILANDHWNFDVRGFNPGGNHGSFFRVSTNSTFMIAGGDSTGIPKGLRVERPYDSLSFVPTLFRLMGKADDENVPDADLRSRGFRKFPGRVIKEITGGR